MDVHALTKNYADIPDSIVTTIEITNIHSDQTLTTCGIWDTGATASVITRSVAKRLGLKNVTWANVMGIHGSKLVPVYYIKITLENKHITLESYVTECDELSADDSVGVLIGMNIITMGDFAVTNFRGQTTMSFRVPSLQKIDFVSGMTNGT
jgi:hypothetical protein